MRVSYLIVMPPPQSWDEVERPLVQLMERLFNNWGGTVRMPAPGEKEDDDIALICDTALRYLAHQPAMRYVGPDAVRPWLLARIYCAIEMVRACRKANEPLPPLSTEEAVAHLMTGGWNDGFRDLWTNSLAAMVVPNN